MADNAEVVTPKVKFDSPRDSKAPDFDLRDLMKVYRTDATAQRKIDNDVRELIFPDVYRREHPEQRENERYGQPKVEVHDTVKGNDLRAEADKRDSEALMESVRSGKLDDLKKLVADMSPEKLKRISEQLCADGFDFSAKDGKFTLFNKNLGVGVSVDQHDRADVVHKDNKGNFVKADDGTKPDAVLTELSKDMSAADAAGIIEHVMKNEKERRYHGYPDSYGNPTYSNSVYERTTRNW